MFLCQIAKHVHNRVTTGNVCNRFRRINHLVNDWDGVFHLTEPSLWIWLSDSVNRLDIEQTLEDSFYSFLRPLPPKVLRNFIMSKRMSLKGDPPEDGLVREQRGDEQLSFHEHISIVDLTEYRCCRKKQCFLLRIAFHSVQRQTNSEMRRSSSSTLPAEY